MIIDTKLIKCKHPMKFNRFDEVTTKDCKKIECPFYIYDNDSGYYPYCIKPDFMYKYKKLRKEQHDKTKRSN